MTIQKIGIGLIILGVLMLLVGGSLFSYQGERLTPIISDIGMISFMFWLPTLITGIILASRKGLQKRNWRICPTFWGIEAPQLPTPVAVAQPFGFYLSLSFEPPGQWLTTLLMAWHSASLHFQALLARHVTCADRWFPSKITFDQLPMETICKCLFGVRLLRTEPLFHRQTLQYDNYQNGF